MSKDIITNIKNVFGVKSLKEQLEMAIKIASENHYGQKDKASDPYILHLIHVMNNVDELDVKIVAVLHDILEDTDITKEDLFEYGFSKNIVDAIELLTKPKKQEYMTYIKNLSENSIARKVKLVDLKHNMDLTRLENITEKDLKRVEKYFKAYKFLDEIVLESDIFE